MGVFTHVATRSVSIHLPNPHIDHHHNLRIYKSLRRGSLFFRRLSRSHCYTYRKSIFLPLSRRYIKLLHFYYPPSFTIPTLNIMFWETHRAFVHINVHSVDCLTLCMQHIRYTVICVCSVGSLENSDLVCCFLDILFCSIVERVIWVESKGVTTYKSKTERKSKSE
mgnify:CR=1 FL=1